MTSDTAKQRRAAFYDAENREFDRGRTTFRPEEPNHRVYARAVRAVLDMAHRGLSPEDFGALISWLMDVYAPTKKEQTP